MKKLPFELRTDRTKIEWYEEPPRLRTIMLKSAVTADHIAQLIASRGAITAEMIVDVMKVAKPRFVRVAFPYVVHGVVRVNDRFRSLVNFIRNQPLERPEQPLSRFPDGNRTGNFEVCFGTGPMRERIARGEIDPIEAFWDSTFDNCHQIDHACRGLLDFASMLYSPREIMEAYAASPSFGSEPAAPAWYQPAEQERQRRYNEEAARAARAHAQAQAQARAPRRSATTPVPKKRKPEPWYRVEEKKSRRRNSKRHGATFGG